MRFQSKYRKHTIQIKGTRSVLFPGAVSPTIEQGIFAEFEGPQRIFDSEVSAAKYNWSPETREMVEDFILGHRHYGQGIYLAPGQELPEDKYDKARVKPKASKRICQAIWINPETSEVDQCPNEPAVGRKYCAEHDADEPKITRGLATSVD